MILFKKAVRSIWSNKKAYISCITLIAISVFMFTAMGGASRSLTVASEKYYKESRLADIFAKVQNISYSDTLNLAEIEGIDDVLARLTYDARVLMPENKKIINLRLISYDKNFEGVPLNNPIVKGLDLANENDIIVAQSFLDIHGIKIDDSISMIVEGKEVSFNIIASALSPEYVIALKNSTDFFPDKEAFNIAFIDVSDLERLTGRENEFNDISFSLENGYSFDDVKNELEDELKKYGLLSLIEQEDQISVKMLDSEINQISVMSSIVPLIFSSMAAIVLYLMMKRIIEQERTQIGTLKAFGYTTNEILNHYLFYGVFTSAVGGVIGIILGNIGLGPIIDVYTEFFILPNVERLVPIDLAIIGFLIALVFGIIGAYAGAKAVLTLSPADSMKPPTPPPIKNDIIQKLPFLKKILSSRGNMAVRNIMRSKVRSLFIIVGIMFSFGMISTIGSMQSIIKTMMLNKFTYTQVFDAKFNLKKAVSIDESQEQALALQGVYIAESIQEIPAELRVSNIKKGAVIVGLKQNSDLFKIYDDEEHINKTLIENTVILNTMLAEDLGVKKGDFVYIKTQYNEDEIKLVVSELVNQNMTSYCYVEINSLNKMLDLPSVANAVIMKTDDIDFLKDYIVDAKNISKLEDTKNNMQNFMELVGSFKIVINLMFVMACLIAFAIIYNTSTISLSEKEREYATLRVLGLQVNEVCEILNFEYWTLFIFGVCAGVPFTSFLRTVLNVMIQSQMDSISLPKSTSTEAYLMAFMGCMLAVFMSNMSAKNNINKFDMVEVLKERE